MGIFVSFVLLFLLAEALLTLVQVLLQKKQMKPWVHILLAVAKALVAVAFAACVLAGPVQLRKLQPFMMAAYVALLADAGVDLVYTVIAAIAKKERRFALVKTLSLICGVLFLTYGILNMEIVTPKYHTYTSDKLTQTHTFVFAADIHVGSAQPFSVTKKTVEKIKAEQPDFLVLGGDITDDYTTKQQMQDAFALFQDIGFPVYYIYGNHDRQGHAEYANGLQYTQQDLEDAMHANGVIILKDEFVQISDDLQLLGREDITEGEGRADPITLANPNPESYLIVADHQPVEFVKKNIMFGTDLQVSGHTHAGQLFPLKWLYALIGGYVYGDYTHDNAILNVSAGACGWRMPLRTDAHCNYEVITLNPTATP